MSRKTPEEVFFEGLGGSLGFPAAPFDSSDDTPLAEEDYVEAQEEYLDERNGPQVDEIEEDDLEDDFMKEKVAQQALRAVTKNNLFSHPEAHPFVLDLALIKAFKLEWFTWDMDTLFEEIQQTFSTSIADINRVKILAAMTLHVTDAFWDQWEVFEKTIVALNGVVPRVGYIQPLDLPELMAGVDIANSIRREEYSEEVGRYTAACMQFNEVTYAPDPLDYCQPYLSYPRYECLHCGNHDSALPPFDGNCDSCSRKFDDDHPFNFKPADDAKPSDNVKYYLKLDPAPVKARFEELKQLPPNEVKLREHPDDIEAAKLIVATDYMEFRRQQRDRQLSEIKEWMAVS